MIKRKQAVLFATHIVNNFVLESFRKIQNELCGDKYDVYMLLNSERKEDLECISPRNIPFYLTSVRKLNALGYKPILNTMLPGSSHFPLLAFYNEYPTFSYYWFVEYDVYYTGTWSSLMGNCMKQFHDYDFISSHVEKYNKNRNGNWTWWSCRNNVGYPLELCVKAFNPICRYSNRALEYIDRFQKEGHWAHSEVIVTTCLFNAGFKIGDFGGTGDFVPEGNKNKYYTQGAGINNGTMRWRPEFSIKEIETLNKKNKLFHPLKHE